MLQKLTIELGSHVAIVLGQFETITFYFKIHVRFSSEGNQENITI